MLDPLVAAELSFDAILLLEQGLRMVGTIPEAGPGRFFQ